MHSHTNNTHVETNTIIKEVHHHHYHEKSEDEEAAEAEEVDEEATIEITEDEAEGEEEEVEGEGEGDDRAGAFAEGGLVILENPGDQETVDNSDNLQENI